jgi:hypothetical protein
VISAIDGTAGIGKTALAVHFGHQMAGSFPDGQLYVNLAGFGPSGSPLAPGQAMREFLDALGIPPEQIPAGLDWQAGLYRSLLAGRRTLVVLDNAADEQQVRPLLPGSPGCLAIVTSRRPALTTARSGGEPQPAVGVRPRMKAAMANSKRVRSSVPAELRAAAASSGNSRSSRLAT